VRSKAVARPVANGVVVKIFESSPPFQLLRLTVPHFSLCKSNSAPTEPHWTHCYISLPLTLIHRRFTAQANGVDRRSSPFFFSLQFWVNSSVSEELTSTRLYHRRSRNCCDFVSTLGLKSICRIHSRYTRGRIDLNSLHPSHSK
jgi:hypothetical protein